MKQRCRNPRSASYKWYGAVGVDYCEAWENFSAFIQEMGRCNPGDSLDRIDCTKGYVPGNCRWVPYGHQARNKRNAITVEYKGEMMPLAEAAERCGIHYQTLIVRRSRGDIGERLFRPIKDIQSLSTVPTR